MGKLSPSSLVHGSDYKYRSLHVMDQPVRQVRRSRREARLAKQAQEFFQESYWPRGEAGALFDVHRCSHGHDAASKWWIAGGPCPVQGFTC